MGSSGSVLGAGLSWLMIALFSALVKGSDGRALFPISLQWEVVGSIGLLATVCGVLAAAAPARQAARLDPAQAMRL
ncbi:MAG: FtsX-like permease family protein [Burkholderiales bacterium]|nr:FtsX-like permease family protein [Burkholderiales bacterium]